ncbi:MAG: hypothetical protein FWC41_10430 [Firmicutes bacterium]|nr:hypothetical protein [Bacillota bacterium]
MKKYVKKPIPIKAEQFNYLEIANYLCNYLNKNVSKVWEEQFKDNLPLIFERCVKTQEIFRKDDNFYIKTLEGDLLIENGAYVIEGIKGEIYACKKEIFEESYEEYKE